MECFCVHLCEFKTEAFCIIAHKFTHNQSSIIGNCGCPFMSAEMASGWCFLNSSFGYYQLSKRWGSNNWCQFASCYAI